MSGCGYNFFLVCAQLHGEGIYWAEPAEIEPDRYSGLWFPISYSGIEMPDELLGDLQAWAAAYAPFIGSHYPEEEKAAIDALDLQGWNLADRLWEHFNGTVEVRYWSEGVGGFQKWEHELFKDCPALVPRWPEGAGSIETKIT